ncbi:MAG: adenylate cyclase, partial [candidate division Zixibacteria bacterium CG_4_9_14_3_um_filter_46_8]
DIRALRAAISMQDGLEKLNQQTGWDIHQKIGINSGRAFCGDVGGTERREYTVMGDDG